MLPNKNGPDFSGPVDLYILLTLYGVLRKTTSFSSERPSLRGPS